MPSFVKSSQRLPPPFQLAIADRKVANPPEAQPQEKEPSARPTAAQQQEQGPNHQTSSSKSRNTLF
ncbi:hypothetical protein YC2023_001575 [Brassica napus]